MLDAGLQALGGVDTFRRIDDISLKYASKSFQQGQSANPDASYDVGEEQGLRVIDLRGARSYRETKIAFRGGSSYWGRQVVKNKEAFILDVNQNVVYPIAPAAIAGSARAAQRRIPHLLLQMALTRAGTLRSLGDTAYDGRSHHAITFSDVVGTQTALYFDARTRLLTKFETLGDDPLLGDVLAETIFADYRDVEGLKVPFKIIVKYAGEVVSDQSYTEIKVNTHPDDQFFAMPKGGMNGPEILGPLSPTIRKLAPDVYFVNGISGGDVWFYSQLFVVFNDYVLVVESPLSDDISKAVIAKIEETAPGKPIKYLVPTHYHTDHLGGIRGYIAKGATVVTTPGNRSLITKIAATPHTIRPDSLSLSPGKAEIETFTNKRVFSDGQHQVELYNVGPNPHADEIVVVYLPKEKILFVSDLTMTRITGPFPPLRATDLDFAQKIRKLDLQIETIANGHGWIGTMAELRNALGKP